jgi:hypothetical protein
LKATGKISAEVIKRISRDSEELVRFIDFVKVYAIAIKIAFRCDRAVAWQLLGILLRRFEKIGMYRRKYDERVDEIAEKIRGRSHAGTVESRLKDILEEAEKLKDEFEKDYHIYVTERCAKQGKT